MIVGVHGCKGISTKQQLPKVDNLRLRHGKLIHEREVIPIFSLASSTHRALCMPYKVQLHKLVSEVGIVWSQSAARYSEGFICHMMSHRCYAGVLGIQRCRVIPNSSWLLHTLWCDGVVYQSAARSTTAEVHKLAGAVGIGTCGAAGLHCSSAAGTLAVKYHTRVSIKALNGCPHLADSDLRGAGLPL